MVYFFPSSRDGLRGDFGAETGRSVVVLESSTSHHVLVDLGHVTVPDLGPGGEVVDVDHDEEDDGEDAGLDEEDGAGEDGERVVVDEGEGGDGHDGDGGLEAGDEGEDLARVVLQADLGQHRAHGHRGHDGERADQAG